jgi:hypothetical protein
MRRIGWSAAATAALVALVTGGVSGQGSDTERERQTPPAPSEQEAAPRPPQPRSGPGADDVFIPSEEIAADEEITFPIDI